MKYLIICCFCLLTGLSASYAQTSQSNKELEESLQELQSNFDGFISEFESAFDQGQSLLSDPETLKKHGEDGDMIVLGDTINVSTLFNFMTEQLEMLPEPFRPKQDRLDGQKDIAKMLPDLLLQASELFQGFNPSDLNGMMPNIEDDIEEILPPQKKEPSRAKNGKKLRKM